MDIFNPQTANDIPNTPTGNISSITVQAAINELDSEKQATLVSGSNIKTINGISIIGSGDLPISGGGEPISPFLLMGA
jgi:hypothetical protein